MARFELLVMLCFVPWLAVVIAGIVALNLLVRWPDIVGEILGVLVGLVGSWFIPARLAMKIETLLFRNRPDE